MTNIKRVIPKGMTLFMVPVAGLEPARCRQRWILSPLRLPFHHTGRCVTILPIIRYRWRPFPMWPLRGVMSPTFAVPGECPWRERLRPSPTAAFAAPSLHPPQAVLGLATVDFESTTSTIPSHRHRCLDSIIHFAGKCKDYFSFIEKFRYQNPTRML